MSRVACIDVPALPLQILRRDRPEWGGYPLAVVAEDRPTATVLSVSRAALALGIRPGMRYAAALGLSRELRAGVVPPARVAEVRSELVGALHRLSPRVEPDAERVSVVWVDPRGMLALHGSHERWAAAAQGVLEAQGLSGAVVVGFRRLPTLAVARADRRGQDRRGGARSGDERRGGSGRVEVLRSVDEETMRAAEALLVRLDLPPALTEALQLFGLRTLGQLLQLPPGEVSVRLGAEALALHRAFSGALEAPFCPAPAEEPIEIEAEVEPPDDDRARLLFCLKGALVALTSALASRRTGLGALEVTLWLERAEGLSPRPPVRFTIEPASASRDVVGLVSLCQLKLDSLVLPARVERLVLRAAPRPLEETQLALTEHPRKRDPKALARGLSRLRAALGEGAVTRGRLESSWAPEASFRWEPVQDVPAPRVVPPSQLSPPLVRRVLTHAIPLESDARGLPRLGPSSAAPLRLIGPYRVQSGWWSERIERDYFYAERSDGCLLWLYREASGRWFLQGQID
jgi:protein ImuB